MTEHIEKIYEALVADCTREDTRKKLAILKSTLDEQIKRGSIVFQLPTLADLMKDHGGAGLSALKNTTGKRYRTLIDEYKKVYAKPSASKKSPNNEDWIDRIEQMDIKFLVKDMRAELRRLRGENDTLRNITQLNIDMRPQPPQLNDNGVDSLTGRGTMQISSLLTSERETAHQLIDDDYLEKHNLYYDEKGALWYESGKYPVQISGRKLRSIFESLLTVKMD